MNLLQYSQQVHATSSPLDYLKHELQYSDQMVRLGFNQKTKCAQLRKQIRESLAPSMVSAIKYAEMTGNSSPVSDILKECCYISHDQQPPLVVRNCINTGLVLDLSDILIDGWAFKIIQDVQNDPFAEPCLTVEPKCDSSQIKNGMELRFQIKKAHEARCGETGGLWKDSVNLGYNNRRTQMQFGGKVKMQRKQVKNKEKVAPADFEQSADCISKREVRLHLKVRVNLGFTKFGTSRCVNVPFEYELATFPFLICTNQHVQEDSLLGESLWNAMEKLFSVSATKNKSTNIIPKLRTPAPDSIPYGSVEATLRVFPTAWLNISRPFSLLHIRKQFWNDAADGDVTRCYVSKAQFLGHEKKPKKRNLVGRITGLRTIGSRPSNSKFWEWYYSILFMMDSQFNWLGHLHAPIDGFTEANPTKANGLKTDPKFAMSSLFDDGYIQLMTYERAKQAVIQLGQENPAFASRGIALVRFSDSYSGCIQVLYVKNDQFELVNPFGESGQKVDVLLRTLHLQLEEAKLGRPELIIKQTMPEEHEPFGVYMQTRIDDFMRRCKVDVVLQPRPGNYDAKHAQEEELVDEDRVSSPESGFGSDGSADGCFSQKTPRYQNDSVHIPVDNVSPTVIMLSTGQQHQFGFTHNKNDMTIDLFRSNQQPTIHFDQHQVSSPQESLVSPGASWSNSAREMYSPQSTDSGFSSPPQQTFPISGGELKMPEKSISDHLGFHTTPNVYVPEFYEPNMQFLNKDSKSCQGVTAGQGSQNATENVDFLKYLNNVEINEAALNDYSLNHMDEFQNELLSLELSDFLAIVQPDDTNELLN